MDVKLLFWQTGKVVAGSTVLPSIEVQGRLVAEGRGPDGHEFIVVGVGEYNVRIDLPTNATR